MFRGRLIAFLAVLWAGTAYFGDAAATTAASIEGHLRNPQILLQTPCPAHDSVILDKGYFKICYHKRWRIAHWVAYHITAADLEGGIARLKDFREDKTLLDPQSRSTLADYRGSGYQRGKVAPTEAFDRSAAAASATHLLSNMAPWTPALGSGKWRLLVLDLLKIVDAHRGAWIVSGNLFAKVDGDGASARTFTRTDPVSYPASDKRRWLRNGRVAVPTHAFKAIIVARDNDKLVGYGFILPNQRERLALPMHGYEVPIDEIERLAGIDLFAALEDQLEDQLEKDTPPWPPKRERRR